VVVKHVAHATAVLLPFQGVPAFRDPPHAPGDQGVHACVLRGGGAPCSAAWGQPAPPSSGADPWCHGEVTPVPPVLPPGKAGASLGCTVLCPGSVERRGGGTCGPLTHNGVAPELSHLPGSHGAEQCLPDLQLEHLAHNDLHGDASFPAVVDHCPLKVILQCLEVEGDLPRRKLSVEPGQVLQ